MHKIQGMMEDQSHCGTSSITSVPQLMFFFTPQANVRISIREVSEHVNSS